MMLTALNKVQIAKFEFVKKNDSTPMISNSSFSSNRKRQFVKLDVEVEFIICFILYCVYEAHLIHQCFLLIDVVLPCEFNAFEKLWASQRFDFFLELLLN